MDNLSKVLSLVKKRRLGNIERLARFLFPYSNFQRASKISTILHSGQSIPVLGPRFWSKISQRVFTKIVPVVATHLAMQRIRLAVYSDKWVAMNAIWRMLLQDRQKIPNLQFLSKKEGKDQE